MKESQFQSKLKKEIEERYENCRVLKMDGSNVPQGFPDLLILYKDKWAALECKRTQSSKKQPNQKYYVDKLGEMSYASFISPENKEDVLNEMDRSFLSKE